MLKKIIYLTLLIVLTFLMSNCGNDKPKNASIKEEKTIKSTDNSTLLIKEESTEELPIYYNVEVELQNCEFKIVQDTMLLITKEMDVQRKAELIAETLSKKYFDGLRINVLVVDGGDEGQCLNVNLIENDDFSEKLTPSWNQNYSASCSSNWTQAILDANFNQKEYEGEWVDMVQYYYEGELNGTDELF